MPEILRYGAYLPRYRTPVKEIHSFYGRPGRPRSRTLATPGLDEDALTMAYEAAVEALGAESAPACLIAVSQSSPFGMRKLSATLAAALDLPPTSAVYDVGGHAGALIDAIELGGLVAARDGRPALVVAADHVVSYEERIADTLYAGGAGAFLVGESGGFATLGPIGRAREETYDVWVLGREPEPRYRLEVLTNAYAAAASAALADLERQTERAIGDYAAVCASQPHPQVLRALGRAGVSEDQLAATSFVGEIGNLGVASVGLALALGLDAAGAGDRLVALGYGSGEGAAQAIEVVAAPPAIGAADRLAGDEIAIGTYYRWTRGRQAEPH